MTSMEDNTVEDSIHEAPRRTYIDILRSGTRRLLVVVGTLLCPKPCCSKLVDPDTTCYYNGKVCNIGQTLQQGGHDGA